MAASVTRKARRAKPRNKFYVGAQNISEAFGMGYDDDWTHPTEQAAINHARNILHDEPDRECCVIVKVVAVVKRAAKPVIVEKV